MLAKLAWAVLHVFAKEPTEVTNIRKSNSVGDLLPTTGVIFHVQRPIQRRQRIIGGLPLWQGDCAGGWICGNRLGESTWTMLSSGYWTAVITRTGDFSSLGM